MNHPTSSFQLVLRNLDECQHSAQALAENLDAPICIALVGTLGAGKTQWTRFFVQAFGGRTDEIGSPTFVLVKEYQARLTIYHLDLYRLQDEDELLELGFEEMVDGGGVAIVEWADRFPDAMPHEGLRLEFELDPLEIDRRIVQVHAVGAYPVELAEKWRRDCL